MQNATGSAVGLDYDGKLPDLYRIFLVNLLLTLVTFGLWRFWAVTRTRRYLWSHLCFLGDRPAYTGTGGEKFRGFLLAALILGAIFAVNYDISAVASVPGWRALHVLHYPVSISYGALLGAAGFSAQRYKLSHTAWRGGGGEMAVGAFGYGLKSVWYYAATLLTFGMLWPVFRMRLMERRIAATRFAGLPLSAQGNERKLYRPFLLGLVAKLALAALLAAAAGAAVHRLAPGATGDARHAVGASAFLVGFLIFRASFGLIDAWFDAAFARELLGTLRWGDLRFATDITGAALFRLRLGNLAIRAATLGLGAPVAMHRCGRFLAAHVQVLGTLEPLAVRPAAPSPRQGLFAALDVGLAG